MSQPALHVDDLYTVLDAEDGLVRAVEGLQLSIERGETFALVGESGCGKSVTALSILRLLPDNGRVTAGRILLSDTDVAQLTEARMRDVRGRRIGIVFQEPATSLNPVLRVGAQIVEAIERHTALRGAAARARALDWLRRVGIPEPERRVDSYPFEMSGGQKQRVMIAIALAAEPDVLIADEPTTALDVTIQRQVLDLLADLQRERHMAMLLITHDLGIVSEVAQRIALMYAGQVVEVATTAEFFARPLHPYARMLLAALPAAARRGERLAAIAGTVPALYRAFAGCRFAERCPRAAAACHVTPPALVEAVAGHTVRCLLYRDSGGADQTLLSSAMQQGGPAETTPFSASQGADDAVAEETRFPSSAGADDAVAENALFPASAGEGGHGGRISAAVAAAPPAEPSDRAATPLLELVDYRVWFPIRSGVLQRVVGYVKAVDGISLALAPGRTLALVGESGCGKTTAGKALLQLLRANARISGVARLAGQPLHALNGAALHQARRDMQIVFQDPFASLNPRLRVAEILDEGIAALVPELDEAARRRRVADLIERVGLRADSLHRFPHEFSGGQRQRIAIARALAVQPRLIVCDEPTSALDVSVQAQILNLLADLQRELGLAYLFITHNFGVVEYLAHDVAVMRAGRIVEAGAAETVLGRPQDPYTRELLAAVPRV